MTNERWNRLKQLFAEALERPEAEREDWLIEQCGEDAELLAEARALLAKDRDDAFLQTPEPPDVTLDDFELLEELGSGGTGIVYRAREKALDREVAIKLLPRHFSTSEVRVRRFLREARAAAKLKHPGVAPIHAVGSQDGSHFFVMELVEGRDLAAELERVRAGESDVVPPGEVERYGAIARLTQAVAEALAHAHGQGVVHRDVKPNNIILTPAGEPKLVDFGLAKDESLGSITVTDKVEGTPYYMSPEQARAVEGPVDQRTDVYSLGAVLYELLTLAKPYTGRTSQEVIHKIAVRDPRPVRSLAPRVPQDLAVICGKAMERDPEQRYASASDLAADLQSFLAGEPIAARPPGLVRRTRRAARRHPAAVGLVAGLVLLTASSYHVHRWTVQRAWIPVHIASAPGTQEVEARVRAWPIDPTGAAITGEPLDLGRLPVDRRMPTGVWRIEARSESAGAELVLSLVADQGPVERTVHLRGRAATTEGMVLVEPGERDLHEACKMLPVDGRVPAFYVDEDEVTNGAYRAYLADLEAMGTPARVPASWGFPGAEALDDDAPVTGISRTEAEAYAAWAGKRLVTHAEFDLLVVAPGGGTERSDPTPPGQLSPFVPEDAPPEDRLAYLTGFAGPEGLVDDALGLGVRDLTWGVAEYTAGWVVRDGDPARGHDPDRFIEMQAGSMEPAAADYDPRSHLWRPGPASRRPFFVGFRCARTADLP